MPTEEPVDQRTHRALAAPGRVRVLEHLRAHEAGLAAAEIAVELGVHPNTVRMHLETLHDAGLVSREREPRNVPGRPRVLFRAVPPASGTSVDPVRADTSVDPVRADDGYRMLAAVLAEELDDDDAAAARAVAAGRQWGRATTAERTAPRDQRPTAAAATGRLVSVLDDLGFAPSVTDGGTTVALHRCPFEQVARAHSRVVCGVHLGLMRGALDALDAPIQALTIEPFVTPGLCLSRLGSVPSPEPPAPRAQGLPPRATEGLPS